MALISDFRRQIQPFNPLDVPNPVASGLAAFKAVTDEGRAGREEKRRDANQRLEERRMALEESLFPLKMKEAENALSMFGLDVQIKNAQIASQNLRAREISRDLDDENTFRNLLGMTSDPSGTLSDEVESRDINAPLYDLPIDDAGEELGPEVLTSTPPASPASGTLSDEVESRDINAPLYDLPIDDAGEELGPEVLTGAPHTSQVMIPASPEGVAGRNDSPLFSILNPPAASSTAFSLLTGSETRAPVSTQAITPTVQNMPASRDNSLDKLDQKERDIATKHGAWVEGIISNPRYRSLSPKHKQALLAAKTLDFDMQVAGVAAERNALDGALFRAMKEPYRDEVRMAMRSGMAPPEAISTVSKFIKSDETTQDLNEQGVLQSFIAFADGIKQPAFIEDKTFGRHMINYAALSTWRGAGAREKADTAAVGEARRVVTDQITTLTDSLKVLRGVESGGNVSVDELASAPAASRNVALAQRGLYNAIQRLTLIDEGMPLAQVPFAAARQTMLEGVKRLQELDAAPATLDREKGAEAQAIGSEYNVPTVMLAAEGETKATTEQLADAVIASISQSLKIPVPTDEADIASLLGQFNGVHVRVVGSTGVSYNTFSFGDVKPNPGGVKTPAAKEAEAGSEKKDRNIYDDISDRQDAEKEAVKSAAARQETTDRIDKVEASRKFLLSLAEDGVVLNFLFDTPRENPGLFNTTAEARRVAVTRNPKKIADHLRELEAELLTLRRKNLP